METPETKNPIIEQGEYGTHNAVKGEALKTFFDTVTGRNVNASRGNVMSLEVEKKVRTLNENSILIHYHQLFNFLFD